MSTALDRFSLKGRVALVTGAGSGMGRHFAQTLSDAGAKVVCAARRTELIESVSAEIRAKGGQAAAVAIDIGNTDSVTSGFDAAERAFGTIDLLINNAGQIVFAPFPDISDEQWNNLINVNLSGCMRMSREFSKRLIAKGKPGSIVNITSITGQQAKPYLSIYGTAKAALIHFTKQLAMDLLPHNIRANSIAPGYFRTEMVDWYFDSDAGKSEVENLPAKRVGLLEELDGPLLLLASDAGSYMNGAIVPVDYGHVVRISFT
ncbi:MAG: family NAD(P)-dependent oxidoreductase [Hydrocarboniphaga sp.]|uniref:SDR family NAD(P)-dependent oxidoreductase n=1 Tax=Hydrocarboniphaga sp. TaxID=2033016 RepID=UPI0026027D5C|nr:SDR family oxidoreductase [Hydrocarboniphaga sp.]MDB5970315.1 family NAD(P)-dependent oxidoreductase [Hydrocarboniphaga sp.]